MPFGAFSGRGWLFAFVGRDEKQVKHGSAPSDAGADRSSGIGFRSRSLGRRSRGVSAGLQGAAGLLRPARRAGAACPGACRAALARIPAFRVGKSLWRLVLEDGYQNRRRGTVERQEGRDQGQHLRGRRADDERLGIARRLRSRTRRHRGDADPRGRRHHRRQGGVRRPLLLGREPHLRRRRDPQSA